jgi:hypothetical protein
VRDPEILVSARGERSFQVEVRDARGSTTHTVEVPVGMADELGWGQDDEAELVRASFAFLLQREPAASILRRFSLDVIGQYFPEYRSDIRRRP